MISNASPLIILAKIDLIEHVLKIYKKIEISEQVYKEIIEKSIETKKQDAIILKAFKDEGKIEIVKLNNKHQAISKRIIDSYNLDKGESETIALAMQLNRQELLMDEAMGRKVTKLFDIRAKGTLRMLLELYRENLIGEKQLKEKVNEIIGKQFRLDAEIINRFWELFENLKLKK